MNNTQKTIMTHEEIVAKCLELDANPNQEVFLLERDRQTFKLIWACHYWRLIPEGARYCIVKQNSYFLSKEEVEAARDRVLNPSQKRQPVHAFEAPQGWRLVPEEPTPEMIAAGHGPNLILPAYVGAKEKADARVADRFRNMLDAAPTSPAASSEPVDHHPIASKDKDLRAESTQSITSVSKVETESECSAASEAELNPEPVAWQWQDEWGYSTIQSVKPYHEATALYTEAQLNQVKQSMWDKSLRHLTDDEIIKIFFDRFQKHFG